MKKLKNYQKNLEKEIGEIFTIANITQLEKNIAYEINNDIISDLLKCENVILYKQVYKSHINNIDFSDYDTELREFILSSIEKTALASETNISYILNSKIYGSFLAFILKLF